MIPKIIHYCWFGGTPLPPLALECIASWRKYLPDYEVWMWIEAHPQVSDEWLQVRNKITQHADKICEFDVNIIPYTAEAYKQKKYAFVSDYARFWIMYKYGGIYFDTDVEVIRPMNDIIEKENFMGFEMDPDGENTPGKYAPGFCFDVALGLGYGLEKGHPFMKHMMEYYHELSFTFNRHDPWLKTIVAYTTEELCKLGLQNKKGIQVVDNITIYPREYFAPINVITNRLHITQNTRTIHRYMGSWTKSGKNSSINRIKRFIPEWILILNNKIKRRKYRIR